MAVAVGAAPSGDSVRAAALKKAGTAIDDRVLKFAMTHLGDRWMATSIQEYLGDAIADVDREELALAIPAILHQWPADPDGPPPAQLWARRNPGKITVDDRLYLHAFEKSWLSIWTVARVEPGVGSALVDALTGREAFVHDAASSKSFRVHQGILAIVLDCDGVQFFGGLHPYGLDSLNTDVATDVARRMFRVRTRPVAVKKLRDPVRQVDLVDLWKHLVGQHAISPLPELRNTDGDPMVPTTDAFALNAPRDEIVGLLAALPGAEAPERSGAEDVVVLMQRPVSRRGSDVVAGHVFVSASTMRVETNSARRADALRVAIEKQLGPRVRHRLRQETDVPRELDALRANPQPPSRKPQAPPEAVAAMREWRTRYMHDWLDEPIPMIDGLTPRAAAKQPKMRTKLMRLIRHVEESESALPPAERIDLSFLRAELGIES